MGGNRSTERYPHYLGSFVTDTGEQGWGKTKSPNRRRPIA